MLNAVEVVLGLGKSDPPYDVGVVSGVATGFVPALSDANALLTMLQLPELLFMVTLQLLALALQA